MCAAFSWRRDSAAEAGLAYLSIRQQAGDRGQERKESQGWFCRAAIFSAALALPFAAFNLPAQAQQPNQQQNPPQNQQQNPPQQQQQEQQQDRGPGPIFRQDNVNVADSFVNELLQWNAAMRPPTEFTWFDLIVDDYLRGL